MFGPFATVNNDATFPVNKFLVGTIIFPRVNSARKTEGGLYIFPVCTTEWPSIYTTLFVFMKSGTDGPRCAQFNIGSSISMRRVTHEGSDASGLRPRR